MTKHSDDMGRIFQDSLFPAVATMPSSTQPKKGDDLLAAMLMRKLQEKEAAKHPQKSRKNNNACRALLLKFAAIAAVLGAAGTGLYKAMPHIQTQWEKSTYNRFITAVSPDSRTEADTLYAARNQNVKMVWYDVGEDEKSGKGFFATYQTPLTMDYDIDGDNVADYRVFQKVDSELFYGYGAGAVQNEVHGSWENYAHPFKDVLHETRIAKGSIENLKTGAFVDFSHQNIRE